MSDRAEAARMAIDRRVGRRVAEDDGRALLAHQATRLAGSSAFPHKTRCPPAATNALLAEGTPALHMRQDRCRGAAAEEGCAFAGAPTTARLAVAWCAMCSITFTGFVEECPEYTATEIGTEVGSTGGDGPGQRTSQDFETTNNPLRFGIARNRRGRRR